MIQTYLDRWVPIKTKLSKRVVIDKDDARPARLIRLRPVGFPIREMHRNYNINIENIELFELYAKEQWMGSIVSLADYLFDQRVIPDFAYQVTKALPTGAVKIDENTIIEIDTTDLKQDSESKRTKIKLADVIGHSQVKKKCRIVMRYLEEPEQFGDWAPRNVLFYGAPGTGKTMTARALANEVEADFMMVRATDLVGEFVGDGSKRIHELYSTAADNAPTIIFIDELDAIALDRSFQSVRGDVSEVVNALLSEMDGLRENVGVVTIAATNNPMLLDKAIRSRFEEELNFKVPTDGERLKILQSYALTLPVPLEADLAGFVKRIKGFSGRDIKEKLLKAALYKAMLEDSKTVTQRHLEESLKEIDLGISKPPGEMFS
ncbi:ATP-dependent zinc metalloprotease FtsH 1 [archaeon BMS3Abin16]|nr:ATP-dependent zinc metalloprotease FtsH 1 [archaeon BMS3Abin16]